MSWTRQSSIRLMFAQLLRASRNYEFLVKLSRSRKLLEVIKNLHAFRFRFSAVARVAAWAIKAPAILLRCKN